MLYTGDVFILKQCSKHHTDTTLLQVCLDDALQGCSAKNNKKAKYEIRQ